MNWQPIETAPKDGTRILMFCPNEQKEINVGWIAPAGIIAFGGSFQYDLRGPVTHWMPLPAPPEE